MKVIILCAGYATRLYPLTKEQPKHLLHIAGRPMLNYLTDKLEEVKEILEPVFDPLAVTALEERSMDTLRERIWNLLDVLRVYSKIPGKKATRDEPFIFSRGSTLMDMAKTVHKDFAQKLKFARIWGEGKYEGQKVQRDYVLQDEDIIELHI